MQVIDLSHGDDSGLDRGKIRFDIPEEFSDGQSISLRNSKSLSWEQSADQSSIEIKWAPLNLSP